MTYGDVSRALVCAPSEVVSLHVVMVVLAVASYCDIDAGVFECAPSTGEILARSRASRSSTFAAIDEAVAHGLLSRKGQARCRVFVVEIAAILALSPVESNRRTLPLSPIGGLNGEKAAIPATSNVESNRRTQEESNRRTQGVAAPPPFPGPQPPAPAPAPPGALTHVHAREVAEADVIAELTRRGGGVLTETGNAWLYRWQMRGHPAARLMHGLKTAATAQFLRPDGCWKDEDAALRYANGAVKNAKAHEWQAGVEAPEQARPLTAYAKGRGGPTEAGTPLPPSATPTTVEQNRGAIEAALARIQAGAARG